MPEKPNANLIKDTTKKPETESGTGLEISNSSELEKLSGAIGVVQDAVNHDQTVKVGQLEQIQEAIKKLRVNFYGEEMTIEEINKIPKLEESIKIWEEIRQGNLENKEKLTLLNPEIAEKLSHWDGELYLYNLYFLSAQAAEAIAHNKGDLQLGGFASISDETAEKLSHFQGVMLWLPSLTSLSDKAAEYLSHLKGTLSLGGLTSLSDKAAEHLSCHGGGFHHRSSGTYLYNQLRLRGLTSLSDKAAKYLSRHQGDLDLGGLTSLSDKAAEHLSCHQDGLELDGLTSLSDKAAEYLSKYKGKIYVSEAIKQQIDKFKK